MLFLVFLLLSNAVHGEQYPYDYSQPPQVFFFTIFEYVLSISYCFESLKGPPPQYQSSSQSSPQQYSNAPPSQGSQYSSQPPHPSQQGGGGQYGPPPPQRGASPGQYSMPPPGYNQAMTPYRPPGNRYRTVHLYTVFVCKVLSFCPND